MLMLRHLLFHVRQHLSRLKETLMKLGEMRQWIIFAFGFVELLWRRHHLLVIALAWCLHRRQREDDLHLHTFRQRTFHPLGAVLTLSPTTCVGDHKSSVRQDVVLPFRDISTYVLGPRLARRFLPVR